MILIQILLRGLRVRKSIIKSVFSNICWCFRMEVFCKLTVLHLPGNLNYISCHKQNNFAEHIKILLWSLLPGGLKRRKKRFSKFFLQNTSKSLKKNIIHPLIYFFFCFFFWYYTMYYACIQCMYVYLFNSWKISYTNPHWLL